MGILIFGFAFLFLIFVFLFMGFVYPIWALVHCANSNNSKQAKTIWILAMIFLWPLGSFAYGLFGAKQSNLRVFVILFIGMCVVGAGLVVGVLTVAVKGVSYSSSFLGEEIDKMDTTELTPEELSHLKMDLSVLNEEINTSQISLNKRFKSMWVAMIMATMLEDDKLLHEEYLEWTDFFTNRAVIGFDNFRKHMRERKIEPIDSIQI